MPNTEEIFQQFSLSSFSPVKNSSIHPTKGESGFERNSGSAVLFPIYTTRSDPGIILPIYIALITFLTRLKSPE